MQDKKSSLTFFSLPDEIIIKIYSSFSEETLASTCLVSKKSKQFSEDQRIWELKLAKLSIPTNICVGLTAKDIYKRIHFYLNYSDKQLVQAGKDSELNSELILKVSELSNKCGRVNKCEFGKKYLSIAMILLGLSEFLDEAGILFLINMCKPHEQATLALLNHPRLEALLSKFSGNKAALDKGLFELGTKHPKAAEYIVNNSLLSSKLSGTNLATLRTIVENKPPTEVTIGEDFKTKLTMQ